MRGVTDYEPYVAEPREPAPTQPRARLGGAVSWSAVLVIALAVLTLWLRGQGQEDPSLQVPQDRLTTPAQQPAAPPASEPAP